MIWRGKKKLDEWKFVWYAKKMGHFLGNAPIAPCSEVF